MAVQIFDNKTTAIYVDEIFCYYWIYQQELSALPLTVKNFWSFFYIFLHVFDILGWNIKNFCFCKL